MSDLFKEGFAAVVGDDVLAVFLKEEWAENWSEATLDLVDAKIEKVSVCVRRLSDDERHISGVVNTARQILNQPDGRRPTLHQLRHIGKLLKDL